MAEPTVIIDCDPGTDDALALLLASVHLKNRILCMISTYGNASLADAHANLQGLTELLSLRGIPVFRGSACPMEKSEFVPTDYHGENGLFGITLGRSVSDATERDGIEALYDLICQNERVIYLALGPLTNLALLLERHPDAAERICDVVIMGGGIEIGNTDCGAEYNFSLDPMAVSLVLEHPVRKCLAMLDFTHTLAFSEEEVGDMVGASRHELERDDKAPYSVFGRLFYENLTSSLDHGNEGAIIHDASAAAYLVCPNSFDVKVMTVRADDCGRLTCCKDGYDISVIERMNRAVFVKLMRDAFSSVR